MLTRVVPALALILALGAASCDSSNLLLTPRAPSYILNATQQYEARFFPDQLCSSFPIRDRRLDLARTATAAIRVSSPTVDGFARVDLSAFQGTVAMDVRARAADGTMLAQRCLAVRQETDEVGFVLATFAPEGARVELIDPAAVRIAGAPPLELPAQVRLVDAMGAPVENGFVSIGPSRPLAATDAFGIARVRTPTDTPSFSGPLSAEVYGVPGALALTGDTLAAPACPDLVWSRTIVSGLTGAPVDAAASTVGSSTFLALRHPTTATSTTQTLELLVLDADTPALRPVASTLTLVNGPIAIDATPPRDPTIVGVGRSGQLEKLVFTARGLERTVLATLELSVAGRVRALRIIDDGVYVLGDVPTSLVRVPLAGGNAEPLLTPGSATAFDLVALDDRLIVATAIDVRALDRATRQPRSLVDADVGAPLVAIDGRTFVAQVRQRSATRVLRVGPADTVTVLGESPLSATPALGTVGDTNGDRTPDLVWARADGPGMLLTAGTPRGLFAETGPCEGPSWIQSVGPSAVGSARFVAILPTTGVLATLERPSPR